MKKIIFLSIALLTVAALQARNLVITTSGGTRVSFTVSDTERPVMRFINGTIWVNGRHFQFAGVSDFRLTDDEPTSITSVEAYAQQEGAIAVNSREPAAIYTLDGKAVKTDITRDGDRQVISTLGLPHGVYIIRAGKTSFKFVKK